MKKLATIILTCIIGMSMTLCPTMMADASYAEEQEAVVTGATEQETEIVGTAADGSSMDGLDGKTREEVAADPQISYVLDDPTFNRYYEIDEEGVIHERVTEMDDADKIISDMYENADGIEDVDNVQTDCDLTAMGGGVSGLGKGQTPAKYSAYNRYHCIDISWWQGSISDASWQKIKAAGVTHAIIRCGYSSLSGGAHNMDSTFSNNVNRAYNAGIRVGVYYYSTAVSAAEAKSEAQYVATILQNYKSKITLPVAYDYETGGRLTASVMKSVGTASCSAFCDTIKAYGYTPMVYANYTTLCNYIDYRTLQSKYKIWLANYTTNGVATTYPGDYYMWQYSSSGKVNGLSGSIDINYIFEPGSASTAPSTVKPASTVKKYKAYTTAKMNYRTGPSTKKKVKGSYKKGKAIYIVSVNGNWAKLSNGYYMNRSHIKYKARTIDNVNYRKGPGTKYKIKGTYKPGTIVKIKKVKDGWAKLSNGYWLAVQYTRITDY